MGGPCVLELTFWVVVLDIVPASEEPKPKPLIWKVGAHAVVGWGGDNEIRQG